MNLIQKSMFENLTSYSDVEICLIEPFYGGSHKQLIDLITNELNSRHIKYDLFTMTAKKWHWRARCSALYFSTIIPKTIVTISIIISSSGKNLWQKCCQNSIRCTVYRPQPFLLNILYGKPILEEEEYCWYTI